jgi:hypothetical protein
MIRSLMWCPPSEAWFDFVIPALKRWAKWLRACRAESAVASGITLVLAIMTATASQAQDKNLDDLLARTSQQVSGFVEQFSEVKCTEHVLQEKIGENNKVERKAESTYDYLVILTNTGGELGLDESRLAVHEAAVGNHKKEVAPLLISNGFATLFLIFHPYYAGSFQFSSLGFESVNGKPSAKIHFAHVPNTKSVAALAVRGREYPLELSGTAWVDPDTGAIAKISAGVDRNIEDIGMKSLRSEVEYAPVRFGQQLSSYWFPQQATVEVETPRQHWRNTHTFFDYKKFSVSTEEQVANK